MSTSGRPAGDGNPAENHGQHACLAVVYCTGVGCRATDVAPTHRGTGAAALRAAVRDRSQAVLVAAPCLRRCQPGGTAAVGWATAGDGSIRWIAPPVLVDGLEGGGIGGRARSRVVADWIRDGAPDPARLPDGLATDTVRRA